jgi:hypothetical protein
MRDAQRASIELLDELVVGADGSSQLGFLRGRCYSSKHPKRRSPKPKLFGAPRRVGDADAYLDVLSSVRERLEGGEWDYLFPRTSVPRGAALDDPRAAWLAGPAPSAEVIRRMRALLRLPPLSLSAAQAAAFSGHSARHSLVCFAKAVAEATPARYSDDELAMIGDWAEGTMVTRYSSEVLERKRLDLLVKILRDIDTVLAHADQRGVTLPVSGGWGDLSALLLPSGAKAAPTPAEPLGLLQHEDSSSGSESEDGD